MMERAIPILPADDLRVAKGVLDLRYAPEGDAVAVRDRAVLVGQGAGKGWIGPASQAMLVTRHWPPMRTNMIPFTPRSNAEP